MTLTKRGEIVLGVAVLAVMLMLLAIAGGFDVEGEYEAGHAQLLQPVAREGSGR
jgi:hypothetical protein